MTQMPQPAGIAALMIALLCFSGCDGGSTLTIPSNLNPNVSTISDTTITANAQSAEVGFSVSDDMTAVSDLTITANSHSSELIDDSGLVITGDGEQRSLLLTPIPAQTGEALITVTVSDAAGQSAESSFLLTVVPQPVSFNDVARAAFAGDENDAPIPLNDKEVSDDASDFDDLLRN